MKVKKTKSRRERFEKVAVGRANAVLHNLDLLGKCSDTRNYDYEEREIKWIFKEIEERLRIIKSYFTKKNDKKLNLKKFLESRENSNHIK